MTDEQQQSDRFPVLPLRDIVVFPHMIVPLFVGREKSVRALEEVMSGDKKIMLVAQKQAGDENPETDELFEIGTLGTVLQLLKLPDGAIKVLVEGGSRAKVENFIEEKDYLEADVFWPDEEMGDNPAEALALSRATLQQFEEYIKLNKKIPSEVMVSLGQIEDPSKMADTIASHLAVNIPEKQELLELSSVFDRLEKIYSLMNNEIGVMQVEKRIRNRVKRQMEKSQREYYLNEQIKAIQKELGESEDGRSEIDEIEEKLAKKKLTKEAREKVTAEVKKLKNMSPMSAEATVVRNYIDTVLALPWKHKSRVKNDINAAREVLDADHYGLEKVKDRIIEYLAVQQRTRKNRGSILCLVGPPGVGKTSLGQSIAKATGRKFTRLALGGVRDESEIRGHRRTYIGSMPGKVIQNIKKVGTSNPIILLDEVDKLGADWRGDPSSALLEVLDPEQNSTFQDHYLEVDYDLSDVMFITTANTLNMPQPLLDRMEIIRLSGYTEDEKVEIAKRHLIPKQISNHGIKEGEFSLDDAALRKTIQLYTREAGVRNIEREIARLARKAVTEIVGGKAKSVAITADNLEDYLGVPKFRLSEADGNDQTGVTTGLAWTEFGGELLNIEAVTVPGKGRVSSTGKLGDVMKESIQATEFFIKNRASFLGIDTEFLQKHDIHVHVPEGATPKDGPSAGVAMVTSLVSAITGIPVRGDVAMTGEITLRGRVLAIGGLKEKLLAALRAGIKTVLIPSENIKDLAEIPDNVKEGLNLIPVSMVDEVLLHALVEKTTAIEVAPVAEASQSGMIDPVGGEGVITH
ncbi:MAG: endopeptidase La [SAR116 cluster bacterium MED-G04]|nr:MAG: endopeptidase La [SAR116 cluster bacterium MED-G04]HCD49107.1 endopeptidase La [Alphaproteobacteria bacterium]HCV62048.1 endopeptidase La [Alphaproteobacteria bacterium]|tara:strand:+ start:5324 stop:7735 length:2412 start_codon:yes stop_codon:yes gene_type:complete